MIVPTNVRLEPSKMASRLPNRSAIGGATKAPMKPPMKIHVVIKPSLEELGCPMAVYNQLLERLVRFL